MSAPARASGRLVLCPTPLGNLEDMTLRSLRELRECDAIFAEDTRVTRGLLRHFDISKPLHSFHERVEATRIRELRDLLAGGKTVAVVTDAGMPGIADPGAELVAAARAAGARVDVLPGPNAALGALVLSGFDISRFRFEGFPPRKPGQRRAYLGAFTDEPMAVIWYEAPTRVLALLEDLARLYPDRKVAVVREYTKLFEQHAIGSAAEAAGQIERPPRGEFVVVMERARKRKSERQTAIGESVREAMRMMLASGVSVKAVVEGMRLLTGLPKKALYRAAQEAKEQASRSRP